MKEVWVELWSGINKKGFMITVLSLAILSTLIGLIYVLT